MREVIQEAEKHLQKHSSSKNFLKYQIDLIKTFKPNPFKSKLKKTKAWLVTWEYMFTKEENQSKTIVNIFDSRLSAEKIRDFIENFYISTQYSSLEKATFASRRKNNPYPAEFFRYNGIKWQGRITCGHNPHLYARLVKNLTVVINKAGQEIVSWDEVPLPQKIGL